jgi:hypothetical protein
VMPLRHIGLRVAAVLPVMLLVIVAGTVALLGLAFRAEGREYAHTQRICQVTLLAACALMAGRAVDLSGIYTGSPGKRGEELSTSSSNAGRSLPGDQSRQPTPGHRRRTATADNVR